jgi:hypothetical protein
VAPSGDILCLTATTPTRFSARPRYDGKIVKFTREIRHRGIQKAD